MISTVRPHAILTDSALNRRRVVENFLWTARRLSTIDGEAVGDKVLGRDAFSGESWYEIKGTHSQHRKFRLPRDGFLLPDSMIEIEHDDSYFNGVLRWSINVEVGSGVANFIAAWPVVDGKAIYGGMDVSMTDQLISYVAIPPGPAVAATDPSNPLAQENAVNMEHGSKITLGNSCTVVGLNGHSHVAICCKSIGLFIVERATVTHRKVLR